jgi:hypothetical protein
MAWAMLPVSKDVAQMVQLVDLDRLDEGLGDLRG